jgi:hypothetical protein
MLAKQNIFSNKNFSQLILQILNDCQTTLSNQK